MIPLDGSKTAEIVLPYAAEIASKLNSRVHLLKVSWPGSQNDTQTGQAYLKSISGQLTSRIKGATATKTTAIYQHIASGKPANEILSYANDNNISLIIMSRHGESEDETWFIGSIAEKVLRAAKQPVLLIKKPSHDNDLNGTKLIHKILLPLDGSKVGETSIPLATGLARTLDAEIILFRSVVKSSLQRDDFHGYIVEELEELIEQAEKGEQNRKAAASKYLQGLEEHLKDNGLEVSSTVVMGFASDQIVNYAEANNIDLISMSSHGRTGISRWAFGSVTDKVLHTGDTPVLVMLAGKT